MANTVGETNFRLPGQIGEVSHGKVRDTYIVEHEIGRLMVAVSTDRISAYDAILPELIPHKGQVLNQMAAELLKATIDVAPNWLIDAPDPNVTIGYYAEPVKVEMIVRGYLLGSAWKAYRDEGMRKICGNSLPDGMQEFQPLETPIVTPTTKAEKGDHDVNITPEEIVERGLATKEEYAEMATTSIAEHIEADKIARERGLLQADTKYEFGRLATKQLIVIDEINTPDSSRYFPSDEYDAYLRGITDTRPSQMSKEFVREWLKTKGFENRPGDVMPDIPAEFIADVTKRYIELYERMLGHPFVAADDSDPLARIEENILRSLESLTA